MTEDTDPMKYHNDEYLNIAEFNGMYWEDPNV